MPSENLWGDRLVGLVPPSWSDALGATTIDAIRDVGDALSTRVHTERIVPAPDNVFRALQVPPDRVRVLIVGQDPYPTVEHAMGLSFSVPTGVTALPPSARNIRTELAADLSIDLPAHFDLGGWADQGVLLLNRHLTTAAGQPGAHHRIGWVPITDRIVEVVVEHNPALVSIIWGREAAQLLPRLSGTAVIQSAHPSPLSAHRGFFGSRPFSRANQLLRDRGVPEIDWSLD